MTDANSKEKPASKPVPTAGGTPVETRMPDDSRGFALAERAAWHLLEKKGEDLLVLDLRGRSDVCDFYVICTGNSDNQVTALAKHVYNALAAAGVKAKGVEGMNDGRWALLDFFDVVVHVFKNDARTYFNLERLWGDAARLEVPASHFSSDEVAARHPDLNFITATGPDRTV